MKRTQAKHDSNTTVLRQWMIHIVGVDRFLAALLVAENQIDPVMNVHGNVFRFERRTHGTHKAIGGTARPVKETLVFSAFRRV